jgi:hypothetical protein
MKITTSSGLVRIAGTSDVAANEDQAVTTFAVEDGRRTDATPGWDPYQVWLTRVKAPREARGLVDLSDTES